MFFKITKSFYLLFLFAFSQSIVSYAQDSLPKRKLHCIGFGMQYTPDRYRSVDEYQNELKYQQAGYELFYRLKIPNGPSISNTAISTGFTYHKGWGRESYHRSSGLGESKGNFEKINWILSTTQFVEIPMGKKLKLNLGLGSNFGVLIYKSGKVESYDYNMSTGFQASKEDAGSHLALFYSALNFELNLDIPITPKQHMIIGARQYLETADGFGVTKNFTSTAFLAYAIR